MHTLHMYSIELIELDGIITSDITATLKYQSLDIHIYIYRLHISRGGTVYPKWYALKAY